MVSDAIDKAIFCNVQMSILSKSGRNGQFGQYGHAIFL